MNKLLKILLVIILLPLAGCALFWMGMFFMAGTGNLDQVHPPRPPAKSRARR